jgi:hemin uptake protein HemP
MPPFVLPRSNSKRLSASLSATSASGDGDTSPPGTDHPVLDSADILRGQKTVEISHNGATYRLQATRLGKLILTK